MKNIEETRTRRKAEIFAKRFCAAHGEEEGDRRAEREEVVEIEVDLWILDERHANTASALQERHVVARNVIAHQRRTAK